MTTLTAHPFPPARRAWPTALGAALLLTAAAPACGHRKAAAPAPAGTTAASRPATAAATAGPASAGLQLRAPRTLMDVPLTTLAGESVKLAEVGKPVTVIGVWATWCRPCLMELPLLDAVKRRYANDPNVSVVAVSIDEVDTPEDLNKVQAMVERLGLKLPVFVDQTGKLARHLMGRIRSVPLLAILDRDLYMVRERGFDTSSTESGYVSAKSALIELARKGELPVSDPAGGRDPVEAALVAALRANLKQAYPELSEERIEELLQNLEERMELQKTRRVPR
jgi:thiol-disulfide isomerase/thioredoxin